MRKTFLRYLNKHDNWLLIYDNAEYGTAEEYEVLLSYVPQRPQGHILLTTRCAGVFETARHLRVSDFNESDAVLFLRYRSNLDDDANARKLASQLRYFPLALECAASYIRETPNVDYVGYSKRLELHGIKVLDRKIRSVSHRKTLLETFHITLDKILENSQTDYIAEAANQFLKLFAFVGPTIDRLIFIEFVTYLPEPLRSAFINDLDWDELLRLLTKYSLAQTNADNVTIHQLLQEILFDEMSEAEKIQWSGYVLKIFNSAIPQEGKISKELIQLRITMFLPAFSSFFSKLILDCKRKHDDENLWFMIKAYFTYAIDGLVDTKNMEPKWMRILGLAENQCMFEEIALFYYCTIRADNIYYAATLTCLMTINIKLQEKQYAFELAKGIIPILDSLAYKLPKFPSSYQADLFCLMPPICRVVGDACITRFRSFKDAWLCHNILVKLFRLHFSYMPLNPEVNRKIKECIISLSQQLSNISKRLFMLRLAKETPTTSKVSFDNYFMCFIPNNNEENIEQVELFDGFDVVVDSKFQNDATKGRSVWTTLVFPEHIRTKRDALTELLNIKTRGLSFQFKAALYGAICALANDLSCHEVELEYKQKLQNMPQWPSEY